MDINLLDYSQSVKHDADLLLIDTGLLEILNEYGQVKFTGSYQGDVMYDRDVDLYLISQVSPKMEDFLEIHNIIFRKKLFSRNILTGNNIDFKDPRFSFPHGYYLGLKTWFKEKKWKIDIWIISENEYEKMMYKDLNKIINQNQRSLILQAKKYVTDQELEIPSVDIYNLILNEEIQSIEEFKDNHPTK